MSKARRGARSNSRAGKELDALMSRVSKRVDAFEVQSLLLDAKVLRFFAKGAKALMQISEAKEYIYQAGAGSEQMRAYLDALERWEDFIKSYSFDAIRESVLRTNLKSKNEASRFCRLR